jgi:hypothetical protein
MPLEASRLPTLPTLRIAVVSVALLMSGCAAPRGSGDASNAPGPSSPGPSPSLTAAPATPCPTTIAPSDPNVLNMGDGGDPLEQPGAYYLDIDYDSCAVLRAFYTIPAEGWSSWVGAFKREQGPKAENRILGVSIVNVTNLVNDACHDHTRRDPPVGPTVDDLASALAALPPFLLTSPPRDVAFAGYRGKHLELTLPDMPVEVRHDRTHFTDCFNDWLYTWVAPTVDWAFHGYTGPHEIAEFWILDVDGSRLVIQANWLPDSPTKDIEEMRAILDSIRIE